MQAQAGHKYGSTTALYTGVSSDFKNQVLLANIRKQLIVSCSRTSASS